MKHYRLLGILLLLENHPVLTAKEIAAHFEVSIRTVYRDLEVLSEAGYGIVTESGKGGGISLQYNKRVRVSAMDEHELIKLVRQFALKSDDASYENIGLKIRSQLPPEAQLVYDRLIAVTLRVNDAGLDRLKGFRMIQMEDDHQITLDFISENIAFNHLILMSEMIRVIRPEALIQKFRQRASQILEQYGL